MKIFSLLSICIDSSYAVIDNAPMQNISQFPTDNSAEVNNTVAVLCLSPAPSGGLLASTSSLRRDDACRTHWQQVPPVARRGGGEFLSSRPPQLIGSHVLILPTRPEFLPFYGPRNAEQLSEENPDRVFGRCSETLLRPVKVRVETSEWCREAGFSWEDISQRLHAQWCKHLWLRGGTF